jgi:hypothetical protein
VAHAVQAGFFAFNSRALNKTPRNTACEELPDDSDLESDSDDECYGKGTALLVEYEDEDIVAASDSESESGEEEEVAEVAENEAEEEAEEEEEEEEKEEKEEEKAPMSLVEFYKLVVEENRWTRETNWGNRELKNIIEAAALKHDVRKQTGDLKKWIKEYVMSA